MKKRKKSKAVPQSKCSTLLRKPWLFAGAVFGLDLAMLLIGLVLSGVSSEGITYTADGDGIVKDNPLAFFGVIAAVVLGINCALIALMIAGAFTRKRSAATILGAAGLLLVSLMTLGSSAYMALGSPVKSEQYFSYSDESLRLIIEESEPYFGKGTVSFYMTAEESSKAVLLARTDISEYADDAERYTIAWKSDNLLQVDFADGINYRTLTITVDRSLLESTEEK